MKIEPIIAPAAAEAETRIVSLFASPVLVRDGEDRDGLLAPLMRAAKAEQQAAPNYTKYLVGGWRSHDNAIRRQDPEIFAAFERRVVEAAVALSEAANPGAAIPRDGWRMVVWANVSRAGAFHRSHAHRHDGCVWSGVFYVDDGLDPGEAESGALVLEDRSGVAVATGGDAFARETRVPARAGRLVLFSPWQFHRVEPYQGARERISIAFNLFHDRLKIPLYPDMVLQRPNWRWEYFKGFMVALEWAKALPRRFGRR
jgi:uncharacterized protein (TIGR02466 family)